MTGSPDSQSPGSHRSGRSLAPHAHPTALPLGWGAERGTQKSMGHCHLRARQQVRAGTGKAALSPGVPPLQLRSPGGDIHPSSAPRGFSTFSVGPETSASQFLPASQTRDFPLDPRWAFWKTETLKVLVTVAFVSPRPRRSCSTSTQPLFSHLQKGGDSKHEPPCSAPRTKFKSRIRPRSLGGGNKWGFGG